MSIDPNNVEPLIAWIVERDRIRKRQLAGEPRPWSDDALFATYRFCNINVSDDRVSRAIFETFTRPYADHPGLIVALTVCRFTNAPEVFEAVRDCLVPFDPQRFVAIMEDRNARGLPLERRAYQIPGGGEGERKAKSLARDLFTPLANAVESIRPKPGDTCAVVFERLRGFPCLNKGFITAQIVRDLKQAEPLRSASDWETFVWSGPGSQKGINRLLGATTESDIKRERPEPEWRELFWEVVSLAAPRVAEQGVEVEDAQSWQNCLCECDKILRWRSGDLSGARKYTPFGEAPARKARKAKPALIGSTTLIGSPAPTEALPPVPHALPELTLARDPNAPHVLVHDVETRSPADLKAAGAHRYASDPGTQVLCLAYAVDDEPVQLWAPDDPIPAEFVAAANDSNWIVIAHNDAFERVISRHILEPRFGFPVIPIERRRCSMAMALAAALPGALDKAVEALGLPHTKDKVGQALMRRMAKPLPGGMWIEDAASREELYRYCVADVVAERELFRALPPLTAEEQQVWELDAVINARGFHTDGELLDAAHGVVTAANAVMQAEFGTITGLDSTNKTAKLIAWLAERDCVVTDVQKGTLRHCLRRKGLAPEVRRAVELRLQLAHASVAKVEALRAWRCEDGRVRGTLTYHGAATGRWVGRGPQPQNFKRDGEDIAGKIAKVMNGGAGLESPVGDIGDIARAMICAAPGHRLLIADFSGIESRVLAWISGQQSKVAAWARFDATGLAEDDPYARIAGRCGISGEGARPVGKTIDLAFGFGGGLGAWARAAPEDDTTDEATATRYRDTWRTEHPRTVGFWYSLGRAALAAVRCPGTGFPVGRVSYCFEEPFLRLMLPSGRAISYPFACVDGEDRYGRPKLTFMDTAGGRFEPCNHGNGAWHGMLVENVVQGIARDLLAAALMRLEPAYPVTLHVHDEIVAEVPDGFDSVEEFRQIITTLPAWAEGLPIAAKVRNGQRFAKSDTNPTGVGTGAEFDDRADDLFRDKSTPDDGDAVVPPPRATKMAAEAFSEEGLHLDTPQFSRPACNSPELTTSKGNVACPFHADSTPSMHIYADHYHCYGCGRHGPLDELNGVTALPPARDGEDAEAKRTRALRLWEEAGPIAGTLAARYLGERRGIDLAALPADVDAVLRFHPRCPFGPGARHPCLVALMRSIATDAPTGIHRTALTEDARKLDRRMLGHWGAIKLWPATTQLVIGEGLETTLSAATRMIWRSAPLLPAWSAISNGPLSKFPIIIGVERLIILVDHDSNGVGQRDALCCAERWRSTGRTVTLLSPKIVDRDFNDFTSEKV